MARVLIVEDERPLRRIIALNLVRRGHSVAEADSVAAADEALAAWDGEFDIILLDINLPDQTGWDVLRHLRRGASTSMPAEPRAGEQLPNRPKVIVLTAVHPPQSRIDEFQPDAVLVKPFPLQALHRLIERVLAAVPVEEESGETGELAEAGTQDGIPPRAGGATPT